MKKNTKKYQIIYADPPWASEPGWFNNKAFKKAKMENHYPTMSIDEICALSIPEITTKNAHLYLWTTSRNLLKGDAWKVATAWGFRPINVLTWTKDHYKYKCSDGYHNSFWATVIESPQWKDWEKEVSRRMHLKTLKGVWDVDECRECGWFSPAHFQDFLKWISAPKENKKNPKSQ